MLRVRRHDRAISDDSDLVWLIHVHREQAEIAWCLRHLRAHYPRARVVVINDGDGMDYERVLQPFKVHYINGTHLHHLSTCHLYIRRFCEAMLEGSEEYCIKIDPDTKIWRRLSYLPDMSSIFGSVETTTEAGRQKIAPPANVQGGFIGCTRDVIRDILDSPQLSADACTRKCFRTWARAGDMVSVVAAARFSDDFLLSWLAGQCGVIPLELREVCSNWRRPPDNSDGRFAVTHPHKLSERRVKRTGIVGDRVC